MNKKNATLILLACFIVIGFTLVFIRESRLQQSVAASVPVLAASSSLPAAPKVETTSATLFIAGDMMLDRNVANLIDAKGFEAVFAGVKDIVSSADIAVVNLEGPFTIYPSKTKSLQSKQLVFTFDPAYAPKLAELGFDIVGLANNHTLNFGQGGLRQTLKYVTDAGMQYYGDPDNGVDRATSTRFLSTVAEKNGVRIGFVGFHEFKYAGFDDVLAEISRLRPEVDVLIVSPHWGPEYQKAPSSLMSKYAHLFIDHGADAVIGAHPHIIGDIEEYKGKMIYYSLGNFAFDQYFSEETMDGLALHVSIIKQTSSAEPTSQISLVYSPIPIRSDRAGVRVATSTKP